MNFTRIYMKANIKLRRFISKYLHNLVHSFLWVKFKLYNFKKKPPILILTPGKVGSSSVYNTLKNRLKSNNVIHIHNLSKNGIESSIKNHLNSDRKSLPLHLLVSKLLYKRLIGYNEEIKIITLLREPISRSISGFYQNIDFYSKELENSNLEINRDKAFTKLNSIPPHSATALENWIQVELKENLGLDIFEEKIPESKGYNIFKNSNYNLLLMRLEDLNLHFNEATKSFFNIEKGIDLENHNTSEKKYYSDDYKKHKSRIKIQNKHLDIILASHYVKHFYEDYVNKMIDNYTE